MSGGKLGRLFAALLSRRAEEVRPEYVHSELGVFRRSVEEDWWEARVDIPAGDYRRAATLTLLVAGSDAPDMALIARGLEIVRDFDAFRSRVDAFLSACARGEWFGYESEICSLAIESINLLWPREPDHAMIYFEGGDNNRLWRCDWVAGVPRDLAFDS